MSAVLIVERDPVINQAVAAAIEDAGFAVLEAYDAKQALDIIERDRRIAVLLTAFDLGGLFDGRQLALAARVICPEIKVIIATGASEDEVGKLPPDTAFLPKPFSQTEVVTTVSRLIGAV